MSTFQQDRIKSTPEGLRLYHDVTMWVWVVPIIALLIAVFPLPYVFYQVLRVIVFGCAAYLAWKEYSCNASAANSFT